LRIGLFHEVLPETEQQGLPPDIYREFVSLETIQAMVLAFERSGHTVRLIDSQQAPMDRLYELRNVIDLVFNFSVGFGSRFRELMPAAMCESVGIPYTGSDPMALAISANKHVTKLVARHLGVMTPNWMFFDGDMQPDLSCFGAKAVVVKPVFEGTSIGLAGPLSSSDFAAVQNAALRIVREYHQPALIEEFVSGSEATVPILGNPPQALPTVALTIDGETGLGDRIFDGYLKEHGEKRIEWTTMLPFDSATTLAMTDAAIRMHHALGCRDLSRSDFRVTASGQPYFLEINAIPFLAPEESAYVAAAESLGLTFSTLLERIVTAAETRLGGLEGSGYHSQNQTSLKS
jgi:D-alanine-D-alanine ligase